ncbi:MAG: GldG family protein [Verrucomicrobia bacterium]|nr:GldG family protein [Kiritimatiellia bacterium]MCO6400054.1 GldG family protein [Verrucomicrobiota bacterium]
MSANTPKEAQQSIRRGVRRRVAFGLNTGAALLLALALVVMFNYVSTRHYWRRDLSRSQFYSLSDKTQNLLHSITSQVDVVVFFQADHPAYEDVVNLLKEYQSANPNIHIERVDPNRDIARAEALVRQYELTQLNLVVFALEGRTKFVQADDLTEIDYSAAAFGGSAQPTAFRGEQIFSSAIQDLAQAKQPVVYFIRGHGERDINDRDPYTGYSAIAQHLRRDNVNVRDLLLAEARQIPADANALILPGPTKNLAPQEIELLRTWLDNNGRMAILLDTGPTAGLTEMLQQWTIRLQDDVVVDPTRTLSGLDLFVNDYGIHPITKNLYDVTSVFYLPRSVEPIPPPPDAPLPADRPRVTALVRSSSESWAESDLEQKPMKFDSSQDRRGPISIAVAAERGAPADLNMNLRPERLVVFGDTDFLSNGALSGGNADLFLSAINWLLEREDLMAISPKPLDDTRLVMTQAQISYVFWIVTVLLPGLFAILGIGIWWQRRA